MTEPGGQNGTLRVLPGVEPALLAALVEALGGIDRACGGFAEQLEHGGVHEHAFGKLVDAAKVRDAYHDRLPKTKENMEEARGVARDFLGEFVVSGVPQQREAGE